MKLALRGTLFMYAITVNQNKVLFLEVFFITFHSLGCRYNCPLSELQSSPLVGTKVTKALCLFFAYKMSLVCFF